MKTTYIADTCSAYRASWHRSFCEAMECTNDEERWPITRFAYSAWSIAKTGFLQETSHPIEQLGSTVANAALAVINVVGATLGAVIKGLEKYSFGDAWDCTVLTFQHAFKTAFTAILWIGKFPTVILISLFRPDIVATITTQPENLPASTRMKASDGLTLELPLATFAIHNADTQEQVIIGVTPNKICSYNLTMFVKSAVDEKIKHQSVKSSPIEELQVEELQGCFKLELPQLANNNMEPSLSKVEAMVFVAPAKYTGWVRDAVKNARPLFKSLNPSSDAPTPVRAAPMRLS